MNWRVSVITVVMIALFMVFSLAPINETLCHNDWVVGVLRDKTKDGAAGCTDLWLNRYQTLLGAVVAVGAAMLAYGSTRRQVEVATLAATFDLIEILGKRAEVMARLGIGLATLYMLTKNCVTIARSAQHRYQGTNRLPYKRRVAFFEKSPLELPTFETYRKNVDERIAEISALCMNSLLTSDITTQAVEFTQHCHMRAVEASFALSHLRDWIIEASDEDSRPYEPEIIDKFDAKQPLFPLLAKERQRIDSKRDAAIRRSERLLE